MHSGHSQSAKECVLSHILTLQIDNQFIHELCVHGSENSISEEERELLLGLCYQLI